MPPYFFPLMAFLLWAAIVIHTLPLLKFNLNLADELLAPQLFISHLILILAWALSGPGMAAALSISAALLVLYVSLAVKEPSLFPQCFLYAVLFVSIVSFLYCLQKNLNQKRLTRERLAEDVNLIREETAKKAGLRKALEQKIERFLDFNLFAETLKGVQETGEVARKIVTEAHHVLAKADECALYLVNESRQELSLAFASRHDGAPVKEKKGSLFDRWVMKRYRPVVVEDSWNDFRFPADRIETARLRSVCASPLMTENRVLGVLRASSAQAGAFSPDDLRLLDIISGAGAVTLRNRLLYERMGELAVRDSLTGLYLYRYFRERLNEEIALADLNRSVFSILMLDVDYFKRYNDEYGHPAGDIVLKSIAAVLSRHLEAGDLAARYGGEEFILLLRGKPKTEAFAAAQKICSEIEKKKIFLRRVESRITASLGTATFPEHGRTADEIMQAADRHLYEAKNQGRNRVCGGM